MGYLLRASGLSWTELDGSRTLSVPGLTVSVAEMIEALAREVKALATAYSGAGMGAGASAMVNGLECRNSNICILYWEKWSY